MEERGIICGGRYLKKALTLIELMVAVSLSLLLGAVFWTTTVSMRKTVERIQINAQRNLEISRMLTLLTQADYEEKENSFSLRGKPLSFKSGAFYYGDKVIFSGVSLVQKERKDRYDLYEIDIKKYNIKIELLKRREPWQSN